MLGSSRDPAPNVPIRESVDLNGGACLKVHSNIEPTCTCVSSKITRRRVLGSAARLAALAGAASFLPLNLRRVLAKESTSRGALHDIKHVVLLMQENRSFDHYFGTMAGVRGFDDRHVMTLPSGKSILYQPDPDNPNGYLLPFHLDTRITSAQRIPSTSHSWSSQHSSWNGGKMDNWLHAHRKADGANAPYVMGYYTRADIPFHFALAESFTLCDAYHSSVMGPTGPNRMYWMTGTIEPDGKHVSSIIEDAPPDEGYSWTTYAQRLEEAGVSWKVYQQEDNYYCNVLEQFKVFREAHENSPLRIKGTARGPEGKFEYDAMNDRLPAVSWIIAPSFQSEHPDFTPAAGAAFIASKIDAIAANPEVWSKTAFILSYDENDGLFDHVAPPVPPPGTPQEFVGREPIGAGFRVPCIIISPWTAGGWVCNQLFDHTSVLQFLEKITRVKENNISDWRRATFGDLVSAFRFEETKAQPPKLLGTPSLKSSVEYEARNLPAPVLPGASQKLPKQERGQRKRVY